jgi:hypothetical protein
MKFLFFIFLLLSYLQVFAQHDNHITKIEDTAKPKSPKTVVMENVGSNHVHIVYSSPSVRGRNIWNGLVAYGQVWATGAHKATWIEFSEDVKINSQLVPKGKYGFFTIPDKNKWTIIISKDWDMHLADNYNIENDLIRITVNPQKNKSIAESLIYKVKSLNDKKGQVIMSWEYLTISLDFENYNANN